MTQHHWTAESSDALAHRIAFDFIAQIEKRMEAAPISQANLARKLKITEGAVSHVLNNPQNLTLKTIAKYVRALGLKATIVAYDDGDLENKKGPISAEVFTACWERLGKPFDRWDLPGTQPQQAATQHYLPVNFCGLVGLGVHGSFIQGNAAGIYSFPTAPLRPYCIHSTAGTFRFDQGLKYQEVKANA